MFFHAFFFRLNPSQITVALLSCAVFFLCAGPAAEVHAFSPAPGSGITFFKSLDSPRVPLALGSGSRDREALSTRNVEETSTTEQLFQGGFIGALFFGYPYKGLIVMDFLALGLLFMIVARAVASRRRGQRNDRFSVDRQDIRNKQDQYGEREEKQRTRVEDLRPAEHDQKRESGNPRDNAWSRRLGGEKNSRRPQVRPPTTVRENAAAMWAGLSSQGQQQDDARAASVAAGADIPASFDVQDFLEGARALYVRLQQAWASRKVDELAPFVSPKMLNLLRKQVLANPEPLPVEILLVNATLNKLSREGNTEKAEVAFSAVMRTGQEEEAAEVDETWVFARGGEFGGMWKLTGIQQS